MSNYDDDRNAARKENEAHDDTRQAERIPLSLETATPPSVDEETGLEEKSYVDVQPDSESGKQWLWLLFFLADKDGNVEEPWVKLTYDEAVKVRDRLDTLIKQHCADSWRESVEVHEREGGCGKCNY